MYPPECGSEKGSDGAERQAEDVPGHEHQRPDDQKNPGIGSFSATMVPMPASLVFLREADHDREIDVERGDHIHGLSPTR